VTNRTEKLALTRDDVGPKRVMMRLAAVTAVGLAELIGCGFLVRAEPNEANQTESNQHQADASKRVSESVRAGQRQVC
jgi:hypothetical protein